MCDIWRCHRHCDGVRLAVSLRGTQDMLEKPEATHNPPIANRKSSDAFCILDICRGTTTPTGRSRMAISMTMLAMLSVIIKENLSTHFPVIARSHCAETGLHRKMLMRM